MERPAHISYTDEELVRTARGLGYTVESLTKLAEYHEANLAKAETEAWRETLESTIAVCRYTVHLMKAEESNNG